MRRAALLFLPAALLLSACGGGSEPPASAPQSSAPATTSAGESAPTTTAAPTTEDPFAADQALIRTLYYGLSQSSLSGLEAHADYISANNHPDTPYSSQECLDSLYNGNLTENYQASYVPDVAAMALDAGWALSADSGRYAGVVPAGRTYIVPVELTESDLGFSNNTTAQYHATVLDGRAYFFFGCGEG